MRITAICGDRPGPLPPSHGFGLLIEGTIAFDACTREAMGTFLARSADRPRLGVVGLENPHHTGGFSLLDIPVLRPAADVEVRYRGISMRILHGRENVAVVGDVVIVPCGVYTMPYRLLSSRGLKARCLVGALGGTAQSPYALHRVLGELRELGVRCLVPLHTPPGMLREAERRFNVLHLASGGTVEI